MSLEKMIALHPQASGADDPAIAKAARHAMLCSLFCTSCADACVAEDMDMAQCIRSCSDCADICAATARIMTRRSGQNAAMLHAQAEACMRACILCAEECERYDHEHCRLCATMCRECANDCDEALRLIH